jgi:hypothetical protein
MASKFSDVEHQGSLINGEGPDESSPLLRIDSSNSKTSVSSFTTKLLATKETADVEVSEMRQKGRCCRHCFTPSHRCVAIRSVTFFRLTNDFFYQVSSSRMQMVHWWSPQRQRSHRISLSWNPQVGYSRAMRYLRLLHSPCSRRWVMCLGGKVCC